MKKLFLFLLLSLVALSATAMTIEEAEAWVGRPLSSNETACVHLLKPVTVRGSVHVLVAHAWAEVPTNQLDNKIPRGKIIERWGKDLGDVTLQEFALITHACAENNKSVFSISACDYNAQGVKSRKTYTDADALIEWVEEIAPFGIKLTDLLTDEEMVVLLPQGE